jgi:undecaprenyl diphosphate synthase
MTVPDRGRYSDFPQHIAIIMDGNRRWADKHGLPKEEGHHAGVESLRKILDFLDKFNAPYVTIFGFSTENWRRSKVEVDTLMALMEQVLDAETGGLHERGIRIRHLGNAAELPQSAQEVIRKAERLTAHNKRLNLSFAFNYGGRAEILNAVRGIISDNVPPDKISEKIFSQHLYTDLPDVDLVIRTGGETRLSNFLIWQSVYAEIYFTDVLWPDFDEEELDKALQFYSRKQRRFGK